MELPCSTDTSLCRGSWLVPSRASYDSNMTQVWQFHKQQGDQLDDSP